MSSQPTLFISHGAPTFALEPGLAGARLAELGCSLRGPAAVLVVSPHWMTPTPRVAVTARPETIHDFGGFDPALYDIVYPAPGAPRLAQRAIELLRTAGWQAQPDERHGLDHGAWVPLLHLFPKAGVPVFQVSLPARLDGDSAWAFGEALRPLAHEDVLIVGSGSLTHNLYEFRTGEVREQEYAAEFAHWVRDAVLERDAARLRRTLQLAPHAQRAHPTPEHFWPLLVAAGAAQPDAPAAVVEGGIAHGVLAMDSFVFGGVTP